MRVLSLMAMLLLCTIAADAKKNPPLKDRAVFQQVTLFNGNLTIDMPANLTRDREYVHYWDNCPDGGYTAAFGDNCGNNRGMSVQINIHDVITKPSELHDGYDPRKHCVGNAMILVDTTYALDGRSYTIIATYADKNSSSTAHTNNYNLSFYITSDGRILEFNYFYRDKDGKYLDYWKEIAYMIANSIKWESKGWPITAKS